MRVSFPATAGVISASADQGNRVPTVGRSTCIRAARTRSVCARLTHGVTFRTPIACGSFGVGGKSGVGSSCHLEGSSRLTLEEFGSGAALYDITVLADYPRNVVNLEQFVDAPSDGDVRALVGSCREETLMERRRLAKLMGVAC